MAPLILSTLATWADCIKLVHTEAACASARNACFPTAITDILQEQLQKDLENIVIYHAEAIITDQGKFSRNIKKVWQKKMYCAELLCTYCKPSAAPFERHEWRQSGEMGRRNTLAHSGWSSLCHSWRGNLQRCKPSLGVHLAVSKLLWELRAGIREQAIPLCLSFCLSVLKSPSALIHSHIQFPALSIHQSPHFVSADFIPALTITL